MKISWKCMVNTEKMWNKIKKMGKFSDSYYDKKIESDMRKELGIADGISLKNLEPDVVLAAFFKVMSPLSMMYEDILCLFEKCEAKESSENLEIEFQKNRLVSTKFNIRHFMYAKAKMKEVQKEQKRVLLNREGFEKLCELSCVNAYINKIIVQNNTYNSWQKAYSDNLHEWPKECLDFEKIIEELPIRESLLKAYRFWQELCNFFQSTGIDRENWSEGIRACDGYSDWEKYILCQETDHCLGTILYNLYCVAERFFSQDEKTKRRIQEILEEFSTYYQVNREYIKTKMILWEEFLKLPVWKKRYEVYSIWVFTKIVSAFPEENVCFYVKNGCLVFPFSGACLASVNLNQKIYDIWTELRTDAIGKLKGRGRFKAIQPDYSIICGEPHRILDTVVVVECKQYKRAGIRNFSNAIEDYAANRPNAIVLLTDYGEVSNERLASAIEKTPENRYAVFSECQPQSESSEIFSQKIRRIIYDHAGVFEQNPECPMYFTLFWEETSSNQVLALHLRFAENQKDGDIQILSYESKQISSVEYDGEHLKRQGSESIKIQNWKNGIYDLWVTNDIGYIKFIDGNPCLVISAGEMLRTIKLKPKHETDSFIYWHVLQIDTNRNLGYIIDRMENIYGFYQCF